MKNTKAVFLIVLGSFLLATGFAFAGALDQAKNFPFSDGKSSSLSPAASRAGGVTATATVAPEVKKPTVAEKVKGFIGEHKRDILLGAVGGYLGFALIGGIAGILTGGIFFLAFFALAAM